MSESADKPMQTQSPVPASAPATHQSSPHKTPAPARPVPKNLPRWKVLLHNDDVNDMEYVVVTVQNIVHLNQQDATRRTIEAHQTGVSLLITTHQELAELYQQQFASKNLMVTIEPETT